VKAVILVGGEGTRLRPLTYTTPKPLLGIAGVPFLERQLTWLAGHGVDDVVLSMGYLPDAFRAHFPDDRFGDVRIRYAVEDEPLGTAGAVKFAAESTGDAENERLVVCNGDVLTGLDLSALVEFHERRGATATIALTQVDDPSLFGVVPTRADGEVTAFIEKPPKGRAPTRWVNAGTYVLEPDVLARIPVSVAVSIERETFPGLLGEPGCLYALADDAYWIDIGTPESYLRAHADVVAGVLGSPPAPGATEHAPGVWKLGPLTIGHGATIEGPSLLGADVSIGAGAQVVASAIGAGASVGEDANVEGSVLLEHAMVGPRVTVSASIVGAHVTVGPGATLRDRTIVESGGAVGAGSHHVGDRIRRGDVHAPIGGARDVRVAEE
jgi:mannose-1-phosphate guanylyltransferase